LTVLFCYRLQILALEALIEFPIITYHHGFTGRSRIDQAFAQAGLEPDIAMPALDADVIKTYATLGLGVGIIASVAFVPERDSMLVKLDASYLFEQNTTCISIRQNHYLRDFAYYFIELCIPTLSKSIKRNNESL
jgi:LysR family cys regulon transcriptional activator